MANANGAVGSVYDTYIPGPGKINWMDANAWVADLNVSDITGWRLPNSDNCSGWNCTGSEMGNMFYNVLGGVAGDSITTTHNSNYDLFNNIESFYYWTNPEYTNYSYTNESEFAWSFQTEGGRQEFNNKLYISHVWALHDGDVGLITSVPIPPSIFLFFSGLISLVGLIRKR